MVYFCFYVGGASNPFAIDPQISTVSTLTNAANTIVVYVLKCF